MNPLSNDVWYGDKLKVIRGMSPSEQAQLMLALKQRLWRQTFICQIMALGVLVFGATFAIFHLAGYSGIFMIIAFIAQVIFVIATWKLHSSIDNTTWFIEDVQQIVEDKKITQREVKFDCNDCSHLSAESRNEPEIYSPYCDFYTCYCNQVKTCERELKQPSDIFMGEIDDKII